MRIDNFLLKSVQSLGLKGLKSTEAYFLLYCFGASILSIVHLQQGSHASRKVMEFFVKFLGSGMSWTIILVL